MQRKSLIFVVIPIITFVLAYGPSTVVVLGLDNRANDPGAICSAPKGQSENGLALVECCWAEDVPEGTGNPEAGGNAEIYCSICEDGGTRGKINCSDPELQYIKEVRPDLGVFPQDGVLEQPPTPPPTGPFVPPQGGVSQQQPSVGGGLQPLTRGQGVLPQDGGLQQQPPADQGATEPSATERTQPATDEEEPLPPCPEGQVLDEETGLCVMEDCPEGQVLDEESGICVLAEPETAAEEPAQSEPEEENQPSEESDLGEDGNN
jgi:hypothetical protein